MENAVMLDHTPQSTIWLIEHLLVTDLLKNMKKLVVYFHAKTILLVFNLIGPGPTRFEDTEFGTSPILSGFSIPQCQELR